MQLSLPRSAIFSLRGGVFGTRVSSELQFKAGIVQARCPWGCFTLASTQPFFGDLGEDRTRKPRKDSNEEEPNNEIKEHMERKDTVDREAIILGEAPSPLQVLMVEPERTGSRHGEGGGNLSGNDKTQAVTWGEYGVKRQDFGQLQNNLPSSKKIRKDGEDGKNSV
ncbi:hypothetical protein H920_08168 [Fukomys damarensis]|uniref:Uncharacterized protein n=1 Tax=Fukomys damarensis TaxID=885580 RepID=A0A091DHA9_FUKDA|nr:hypothetical protein H920_08168 [Fukomys damarensis]